MEHKSIKPSHLPKELTAQQYEALSDELKGEYNEIWQFMSTLSTNQSAWQDAASKYVKDKATNDFDVFEKHCDTLGMQGRTIYRLKSQQAGQEVKTVEQAAETQLTKISLVDFDKEEIAVDFFVYGAEWAGGIIDYLRTKLDQANKLLDESEAAVEPLEKANILLTAQLDQALQELEKVKRSEKEAVQHALDMEQVADNSNCKILFLEEELEKVKGEREWINVEDRLPEINKRVIVKIYDERLPLFGSIFLDEIENEKLWSIEHSSLYTIDSATHWINEPQYPIKPLTH